MCMRNKQKKRPGHTLHGWCTGITWTVAHRPCVVRPVQGGTVWLKISISNWNGVIRDASIRRQSCHCTHACPVLLMSRAPGQKQLQPPPPRYYCCSLYCAWSSYWPCCETDTPRPVSIFIWKEMCRWVGRAWPHLSLLYSDGAWLGRKEGVWLGGEVQWLHFLKLFSYFFKKRRPLSPASFYIQSPVN